MTRKELIVTTARKLIVQHGFQDASIGKIAKEAGIPVGSVYTYFESKEALINEIYLTGKLEMSEAIFQPTPTVTDVREELNTYWHRAIAFGLQEQEKFFFVEQFANSPLIQKAGLEQALQRFDRVYVLLQEGINKSTFKPLGVDILYHLIYNHITGTIKYLLQTQTEATPVLLDQLFTFCWDGICQ